MCIREYVVRAAAGAAARIGRLVLGALFGLGGLGCSLGAQATSALCKAPPDAVRIVDGWYLSPAAGESLDSGRLLLGWPFIRWSGIVGDLTPADTSGAGVLFGLRSEPQRISQPVNGSVLDGPRTGRVATAGLDVIFSAAPARPPLAERTDSMAIWGGRIADGRWRDLTRIAVLPPTAIELNQIVGDGMVHRGELVAAIISKDDRGLGGDVVLVRGQSPVWRTERLHPGLLATGYVDLLSHRDTLWIVVRAASTPTPEAPPTSGVWLMHETATGWSAPRLIHAGSARSMREPRVVGTAAGLVVSWVDGEGGSTKLHWRGVTRSTLGAVHERPIHLNVTRGIESWHHWLGVSLNDSTAQILELSSNGAKLIAELPTVLGLPPFILGTRDLPVAIMPGFTFERVASPYWLTEHDLRCALGREGARQ